MRNIRRIFFIILCFCLIISSAAELLPIASAASSMTASEACVAFIKDMEGFSSRPYYDYGQYTVGYGTRCPDEKYDDYAANGIPRADAEALLQEFLADMGNTINEKLIDRYNLTLTQNQFDALLSFTFNIGTGWITSNSTLKDAILNNASDNELVYAFGLYCAAGGKYSPGLINRRLCEANIYLNGVYSKTASDDYGYVYYDANGGRVTYRVQGFISNSAPAPAADAQRSGDEFLGWYTELNGGTRVTTLDSSLTGRTLFARWRSDENAENQNSTGTKVRVTGDVVNIRSGPGTNYGTVRYCYQNDILTVSHVTHLTNTRWGKVQNGWICLDYTNYDAVINGTENTDPEINDAPLPEATVPDTTFPENDADPDIAPDNQEAIWGVVDVDNYLNIRRGPGTMYPTVGFLFNNTKVHILEQTLTGATTWGRIEAGWISMDYIITGNGTSNPDASQTPEQGPTGSDNKVETVSIKGTITADALRIRSDAGTQNPIVGFYYHNDPVVISEKKLVDSVYWGRTNKGWISLDYVSTDSAIEKPVPPAANEKKTIIADCLRIRKDAGTNYKIVGLLYYGDTVTVSETKDVDGTPWGKVDTGWICMTYVN